MRPRTDRSGEAAGPWWTLRADRRDVPAHRKTLLELVADQTFLARRHADRLLDAPLERADLRELQGRYYAAGGDVERRAIARRFEDAVRRPPENPDAKVRRLQAELDAIINAPPEPYDPAQSPADSERFARALEARRLRSDGLTLTAIARELGVSPSTVHRLLAELAGRQAAVRPAHERHSR
jgi:AraC-like DNA-binding protein